MSYIKRNKPIDKQAQIEYRNITTSINHNQVLNTYGSLLAFAGPIYNFNFNQFNELTPGVLQYNGTTTEIMEIKVYVQNLRHLTAGTTIYEGAIFHNNILDPLSPLIYNTVNNSTGVNYTYKYNLTMNPGDTIEFKIRNISRTESGSYTSFSLIIKTLLDLS